MMHVDPAVLEQLTDEQQQLIEKGHMAFMASTKENGEFIATQALADPSRSKVVRGNSNRPEVTDGPFVEAKEFMGGFYLLDVANEARAVELALQIPDARIPGLALEIRPVGFAALGDGWPVPTGSTRVCGASWRRRPSRGWCAPTGAASSTSARTPSRT